MAAPYGNRYPGSGTVNPFAGGPEYYPLNNVAWVPITEEVEVETCDNVRIRIPARGFVHWLQQKFGSSPQYQEEVICRVETQIRQTGVQKVYLR